MQQHIKAIETFYKGYHFRSRLEARWAVFFDTLGVSWEYEAEGYQNEDGSTKYLPDFKLGNGLFVEVKGDPKALIKEHDRYVQMLDFGGILPNFSDSFYNDDSVNGLILLGDIPEPSTAKVCFHPIIQHHKGLVKSWGMFFNSQYHPFDLVKDSTLSRLLGLSPCHGLEADETNWEIQTYQLPVHKYYKDLYEAYAAARAARFEHGQKGVA